MKRLLKWFGLAIGVLVVAIGAMIGWASSKTNQALEAKHTFAPIEIKADGDLELGRRIVMIRNGCVDCHGKDLAGFHVINDPAMGQIWGTNLTRLKDWSDTEIAHAIRNGIDREGRGLVLMPSHEYQNLSFDDLRAVLAYLRSLPEIERETPNVQLGPLAKVLFATGKLPSLIPAHSVIPQDSQFVQKPEEAPTAEFGKYLVTASCTGCHGADLTGGPIPGGPPSWAPASNLRQLANKNWNLDSFVDSMRKGMNSEGLPMKPPMPVELTKQMSDTELNAIWAYLETVQFPL